MITVASAFKQGRAPRQASNAGFNRLAFFDDFKSSSTIAPTRSGSGFNWWPGPNSSAVAYTVSNSELVMTDDPSSNSGGLQSILNAGATPGPNVFSHGYFEAKMKYPLNSWTGANGWPAFWALDSNWPNKSDFSEVDFMEGIPTPRTAGTAPTLYTSIHEWNTNFGAETANNVGSNVPSVGSPDYTQYHKYGCLWTTNHLLWYFDDVATNISVTTGPSTSYAALETGNLYLVIGTGHPWTCTFDWVKVWTS